MDIALLVKIELEKQDTNWEVVGSWYGVCVGEKERNIWKKKGVYIPAGASVFTSTKE